MRKFSALWFQSKHNLSIVYWFHMDQRKMSAALRLLVQPQMFKTFQKNNEMLLINEVCQSYINTEIFKQNKKTWALTHNCLEIQLSINIHNNDSNKCKK